MKKVTQKTPAENCVFAFSAGFADLNGPFSVVHAKGDSTGTKSTPESFDSSTQSLGRVIKTVKSRFG